MKKLIKVVLSFLLMTNFVYSQDFVLDLDDTGDWSGTFLGTMTTNGGVPPFSYLALGRSDAAAIPVPGSSSFFGNGAGLCNILPTDNPLTGSIDAASQVAFPDNSTLLITNSTTTSTIMIIYWDLGTGQVNLTSYPYPCTGVGTADISIAPGESMTFSRTGIVIAPVAAPPVPTLSQWGLIILFSVLAIIGLIAIRQRSVSIA